MGYLRRVPGWALIVLGAPFLAVGAAFISIEHRNADRAAALDRDRFPYWWMLYNLTEWTCWTIGTPLFVLGAFVVNAGRVLIRRL